jgi:hypothetical protein
MFAREVDRFDPAPGLHDPMAAGLDQVVEELHVELVVLNYEHGLGHEAIRCISGDISLKTLRKGESCDAQRVKDGIIHTS